MPPTLAENYRPANRELTDSRIFAERPLFAAMAAPWDRDEVEARIGRRLQELGVPPTTLAKQKGYPKGLFEKPPDYGRRLDQLVKIADALDWELPDVLGISTSDKRPEMDLGILCEAIRLAAFVMQAPPQNCPFFASPKHAAEVMQRCLGIVRALAQQQSAFLLDEPTLQALGQELREILPSKDSSKS